MDIEHSLYRTYERIISNDAFKLLARYCCVYLSFILGFSLFIKYFYNENIKILKRIDNSFDFSLR